MICDKDTIISISGAPKKEYLEKKISYDLEKIIEERKTVYFGDDNKAVSIYDDEDVDEKYSAQVISPIIAEGDTVGAVIIVSKEGGKKFNELEMKLAETASSFLGKQMEE